MRRRFSECNTNRQFLSVITDESRLGSGSLHLSRLSDAYKKLKLKRDVLNLQMELMCFLDRTTCLEREVNLLIDHQDILQMPAAYPSPPDYEQFNRNTLSEDQADHHRVQAATSNPIRVLYNRQSPIRGSTPPPHHLSSPLELDMSSVSPIIVESVGDRQEVPAFDEGQSEELPLPVEKWLIDNICILDVLSIWEIGTQHLPPVKRWDEATLGRYSTQLSDWQLIKTYFHDTLHSSQSAFETRFRNCSNVLFTVSEVIDSIKTGSTACGNDTTRKGTVLTKEMSGSSGRDTVDKMLPLERSEVEVFLVPAIAKTPIGSVQTIHTADIIPQLAYCSPFSNDETSGVARSLLLPSTIDGKMITALQILDLWENGSTAMPPVRMWSIGDISRQQDQFATWEKIVSIFKTECNSSYEVFRRRFSTSDGDMLPISTIIKENDRINSVILLKPAIQKTDKLQKRLVPILPYPPSMDNNKLPIWPLVSRKNRGEPARKRRKRNAVTMPDVSLPSQQALAQQGSSAASSYRLLSLPVQSSASMPQTGTIRVCASSHTVLPVRHGLVHTLQKTGNNAEKNGGK